MKRSIRLLLAFSFFVIALSSCKKDKPEQAGEGFVYVMDNDPADNHILVYKRATNGTLVSIGNFSTGGMGSGTGLGSQGAVILHDNYLFTCNAGSNDISVFGMTSNGLTQVDQISSHGTTPVSLSVHQNLLYVLNSGKDGNISGFTIMANGHLKYLTGSDRSIGTGGAQIEFNPAGTQIVVTQKPTNTIYTFALTSSGLPAEAVPHASAGPTPFGFKFASPDLFIVSEAFGGEAGQSAVSSYRLNNNGNLKTVTPSAATHQTAACWIAVTRDGQYAYSANAGSANVSGYRISNSGALALLDANGITGSTDAGPTDMAMSSDSQYLYVLNTGGHSISLFKVEKNGGLTSLGDVAGLPATVTAIAAM